MGPVFDSVLGVLIVLAVMASALYFPFRPQWARLKRSIQAWQRRDEMIEEEEKTCRAQALTEVKAWTQPDTGEEHLHEKT